MRYVGLYVHRQWRRKVGESGHNWGGVTKARAEESGVIGERQRSRPTQLVSLSERCKLPGAGSWVRDISS